MNNSFRENIKKYSFILGSQSPRRKELLGYIIPEFKTISKDVDETVPENIDPIDAAKYLAQKKGDAFQQLSNNEIVITSDTIVYCKGKLLAKPVDEKEAKEMLMLLSGNEHQVITGVHIKSNQKSTTFDVHTKVYFDELNHDDIDFYIKAYKPFDKAGSYGIQEWIGAIGIKKINGDYYTVMGLPVNETYRQLRNFMQQ